MTDFSPAQASKAFSTPLQRIYFLMAVGAVN